jgi:hypothetical protein
MQQGRGDNFSERHALSVTAPFGVFPKRFSDLASNIA